MLYRHHTYDIVNGALDQMALQVANTIQRAGYRAFPPASKRASDEKIAGIFSHKLAAHMAGLGWIGRSCLLITPDHGPRVRWIAVLTDAPLTDRDTHGAPVGKRTACVDACPIHAFTGEMFAEDEPREARFDAAACDRYFKAMEKRRETRCMRHVPLYLPVRAEAGPERLNRPRIREGGEADNSPGRSRDRVWNTYTF